jgi:hypothetical protein
LENQADISIMCPELLRSLERVDHHGRMNGVVGIQLELCETGYLEDFFKVYASADV